MHTPASGQGDLGCCAQKEGGAKEDIILMRGEEDVGDQEGREEIEVQGEYGCGRKEGKMRVNMRGREKCGSDGRSEGEGGWQEAKEGGEMRGREGGRQGAEDLFLGRPRQ